MACAAAVTSAMYFDQSQNGTGSSCWLCPPQIFEVREQGASTSSTRGTRCAAHRWESGDAWRRRRRASRCCGTRHPCIHHVSCGRRARCRWRTLKREHRHVNEVGAPHVPHWSMRGATTIPDQITPNDRAIRASCLAAGPSRLSRRRTRMIEKRSTDRADHAAAGRSAEETRGKRTMNVVVSSAEATSSVPPCAWTISHEM